MFSKEKKIIPVSWCLKTIPTTGLFLPLRSLFLHQEQWLFRDENKKISVVKHLKEVCLSLYWRIWLFF